MGVWRTGASGHKVLLAGERAERTACSQQGAPTERAGEKLSLQPPIQCLPDTGPWGGLEGEREAGVALAPEEIMRQHPERGRHLAKVSVARTLCCLEESVGHEKVT